MNRYFSGNDFDDIYQDLVKGIMENPDYEIKNRKEENLKEFLNVSICLESPDLCFALCRDMSLNYLKGELDWYLSGDPRIEPILKYSKFWKGISDDGWSANSNYGKLLLHDRNLHNFTQFEYAKSCLLNNPESKKAVMIMYSKDNSFKSKDNICTLNLQYFIRDHKLYLFTRMRSSDMYFGMPYDFPFFVLLQFKMLYALRNEAYPSLKIGSYNHTSGSLHIYERNFKVLQEAIKNYEPRQLNYKYSLFDDIIKARLHYDINDER